MGLLDSCPAQNNPLTKLPVGPPDSIWDTHNHEPQRPPSSCSRRLSCRPPAGGGAGEDPPGEEPGAGAGPAADVHHQPGTGAGNRGEASLLSFLENFFEKLLDVIIKIGKLRSFSDITVVLG